MSYPCKMPSNRRSSSIDRRRKRGNSGDRGNSRGRGGNVGGTPKRERISPASRDHRDHSVSVHNSGGRDRSPLGRSAIVDHSSAMGKMHEDHTAAWNHGMDSATKKRFTGRCRLFVGNLPGDLQENELRELFSKYGEISECYLSGKGFGFVRLDTRAHAEVAKEELDGFTLKGRPIRVRFAVHGAAIKVKGLSSLASNELLYQAFSLFGEVERAVHIVDDRGRPTGEGIVEFEKKPFAMEALRQINESVFLLTANPRPIVAEPLEPKDDDDGLVERMIMKNPQYQQERSFPPRFAAPGSFEFDFGSRWKDLYQIERVKREQLEQELKDSRERLENEMEVARQEHQAALLREDLRRRQEELERIEATKRERLEMMRRQEERLRVGNIMVPVSQPSAIPSLFGGGFPRMGIMGPSPQQQQPQPYPPAVNRQEGNPMFGRPQPRAGGFGMVPPTSVPQGVGLLGHQPPNPFFGGPEVSGFAEPPRQQPHLQQHGRDRNSRGSYDSSRRRHR